MLKIRADVSDGYPLWISDGGSRRVIEIAWVRQTLFVMEVVAVTYIRVKQPVEGIVGDGFYFDLDDVDFDLDHGGES